jgi:predicted TPR repeat methyltransferase
MEEEIQPRRNGLRRFIEGVTNGFEATATFLDEAWVKVNNLTETNYNLACEMVRQGRVDDAIFRFKVTLWLAPEHVPSMYNLGCLYHHKGQEQRALDFFSKVIKADPKHDAAIYMIATIDPTLLKEGMQPKLVPHAMLVEYFDNLAPAYDAQQRQYMYKLPQLAHQLLHQHLDEQMQKQNLLDLGCGTGLAGEQCREEFVNVYGVDVSAAMLEQAGRRFDKRGVKIYSRLYHQDARLYLNGLQAPAFQVVMALQLLPYIGDADSLFLGLNKSLVSQGLVVLSFDPYPKAGGYGVMPATGYFGHHIDAIRRVAEKNGFDLLRHGEVEAAAKHQVELCIFRKRADVSAA